MHIIDEDSPLYGLEKEDKEDVIGFVVTMTGYDATYCSTTYARATYNPDDLRRGFKFSDIISYLDDGRLFVDYQNFNKIEQLESKKRKLRTSFPRSNIHARKYQNTTEA